MILINAPSTRKTYPILAFLGPKTTTRLFFPVALSPSWPGNWLTYTIAATRRPMGIPAKIASLRYAVSPLVWTRKLPTTISGPKFKPIKSSPNPFLDANLNGGAV